MFLNPVVSGYCTYSQLKDGSMNLYDIFVLNELISYKKDYESLSATEWEQNR
jgi:hypothetical protein